MGSECLTDIGLGAVREVLARTPARAAIPRDEYHMMLDD